MFARWPVLSPPVFTLPVFSPTIFPTRYFPRQFIIRYVFSPPISFSARLIHYRSFHAGFFNAIF